MQTACLYKKTLRANKQGNDEICPLPGEGFRGHSSDDTFCAVCLWKQVHV